MELAIHNVISIVCDKTEQLPQTGSYVFHITITSKDWIDSDYRVIQNKLAIFSDEPVWPEKES